MARPARAVIDLAAIQHNYRLAKNLGDGAPAVAIIKADAYGHGAVKVAQVLESEANAFGVACIEEALELRAAGIEKPVLLLEGFFTEDELPVIAEQNFWTAIHSPFQVEQILRAQLAAPINVWLKMDSGMHRLGLSADEARKAYTDLAACAQVNERVLMTHFACADELDNSSARDQLVRFDAALGEFDAPHSVANSPATLSLEAARRQWQRPGLMLYGASPFPCEQENASKLRPAMSFETAVIALRDLAPGEAVGYAATYVAQTPRRIATIAIGYADGYSRHLGNGSPIIVNGQRASIAGRVSMDMVTVDVTDVAGVEIGSPVQLWGDLLPVEEVAEAASTIPYTLFTGVSKRVPRIYK